jgi:hypothetical protein
MGLKAKPAEATTLHDTGTDMDSACIGSRCASGCTHNAQSRDQIGTALDVPEILYKEIPSRRAC